MEIDKVLTLSTAHIKNTTAEFLTHVADKAVYSKGDYGWFIHVPSTKTPSYPDLQGCLSIAAQYGCVWLCLDRDGPTTDKLSIFDW